LQSVQAVEGDYPAGAVFTGIKVSRLEADSHSYPSILEVKNEWSCTFSSPYAFLECPEKT
jgi:hypothetical protein